MPEFLLSQLNVFDVVVTPRELNYTNFLRTNFINEIMLSLTALSLFVVSANSTCILYLM